MLIGESYDDLEPIGDAPFAITSWVPDEQPEPDTPDGADTPGGEDTAPLATD